jgi:hypothetical protein
VNAHPGAILADAHPTSNSYQATNPTRHERAVVWQYAPGAWAMASGASGATKAAVDQANLALARAIRPGSTPIRVPFRLSYLPPGLAGESADVFHDTVRTVGQSATLALEDGTPAGSPVNDGPWGSAMDVTVWTDKASLAESDCPKHPRRFTVGARTGCFLTDHGATSGLLIDLPGHPVRLLLDAGHYGTYSDAELVRILAGLTFAPNLDDETTWFPAGSALP